MQILFKNLDDCTVCFECDPAESVESLRAQISDAVGIPSGLLSLSNVGHSSDTAQLCESFSVLDLCNDDTNLFFQLEMKLDGGIDFQHREGSKIGSGGQMSESQAALERKERLRKLALETIDITKDPYITKNNLGTFECKLCLTVHPNEGNYLAHTQGKRHQYNLGRRAAQEAKNAGLRVTTVQKEAPKRNVLKIGRPGYKVRLLFSSIYLAQFLLLPLSNIYYLFITGDEVSRPAHDAARVDFRGGVSRSRGRHAAPPPLHVRLRAEGGGRRQELPIRVVRLRPLRDDRVQDPQPPDRPTRGTLLHQLGRRLQQVCAAVVLPARRPAAATATATAGALHQQQCEHDH